MKKLVVALSLVLAIGGCGSGIEKEMNGWKDKMCACKDAACTEKTMEDYRAWTKTKRDEAKKMDKSELEKLDKIEDEMKACRKKHDTEAAPPAPAPTP